MPLDSAGNQIKVGSRVMFRGKLYTIKAFKNPGQSSCGTYQIEFEEDQHTSEVANEISVDRIKY